MIISVEKVGMLASGNTLIRVTVIGDAEDFDRAMHTAAAHARSASADGKARFMSSGGKRVGGKFEVTACYSLTALKEA